MKTKTPIFFIFSLLLVSPVTATGASIAIIEEHKKAVAKSPNDASAHFNLGLAHKDLGQYTEAIRELQEVLRIMPGHAEATIALGDVYILLGRGGKKRPPRLRPEEAVIKYKKAILENPDDAEAHKLLGDAYGKLGRYHKAITEYKEALRTDPANSDIYTLLGVTYYKLRWFSEAIAEFKQALSLSVNGDAYIYMGLIYKTLGTTDKPVKESLRIPVKGDYAEDEKRAVQKNPNDPNAHYILGNSYIALGWYAEAIKEYKEVIRLNSSENETHYNLGIAYEKLGRYREAIEKFKNALKVYPKDAWANYNLGKSYDAIGLYQDAIVAFEKALLVKPEDHNVNISLGLAYKRVELQTHPSNAEGNIALGNIFLDMKRYSEAATEFQTALQFDPTNSDTHYKLALAYRGTQHGGGAQISNRLKRLGTVYQKGQYGKKSSNKEKAILEFHKALRLGSDTALVHTQLGKTYFSVEKHSEAIAEFKEAIKINPKDANGYFILGHTYKILDMYKEAIHFLRKAIKLNPKHSDAYYSLGEIYRVTNRPGQSNVAFEDAYSSIKKNKRSSIILGEFEIVR